MTGGEKLTAQLRALQQLATQPYDPRHTEAALALLEAITEQSGGESLAATTLLLCESPSLSLAHALSFWLVKARGAALPGTRGLVPAFLSLSPNLDDRTTRVNCLSALHQEALRGEVPEDSTSRALIHRFLIDALHAPAPCPEGAIDVLQAYLSQAPGLWEGAEARVLAESLVAARAVDPAWLGPQVDDLIPLLASHTS